MMQVSSSTSAEGRNHPEYMAAAASKGHGKSSIVLKLGAHYLVRCLGIWSVDGSWGSSWRDTADVEEFFNKARLLYGVSHEEHFEVCTAYLARYLCT